MQELTLKNWLYKQSTESHWRPARPGLAATEIHPDLHANGEIPDPFQNDNEKALQWIGCKNWEYKTTFAAPPGFSSSHLVFEGLDTFADVYLNGTLILSSQNMFTQHTVDVKEHISSENELRIYFHSAFVKGRDLEKVHGKLNVFMGETSRLHVRKAQYHYGWDWGPSFMTCGPYRPVRLLSFDGRIEDVFVDVNVGSDLTAEVDIRARVVSSVDAEMNIVVTSPSGDTVASFREVLAKGSQTVSNKLTIASPDLWYPFTHGNPSLYTFTVSLVRNSEEIHTISKDIGLRRVELVQEPFKKTGQGAPESSQGTSFYFKINNIPVYSSGSDWIPAHSFQTCLTPKDYADWMQLMVQGNQNMLRIWGGGYYEQDILYQECDRLGIMIFHDFMFACGQYPGYKEYIDLVSEEVVSQLKRLRNYCSIVLFAGNNEDYQVAESYKLQWDKEDVSGDYSGTNFPARTLYEKVFPQLVAEFTTIPYHPGSPWGGKSTSDPTVGDIHQWNVWHGVQEKYQNWYKLGGRFVSEFGMQALPCKKTFESCITDPEELYPQSSLVDWHNKSEGYERRLALYVIENIKVGAFDLDSWIYATQLMQAECLGYAYKCWRRQWKGDGERYSGGALVWQTNDCWPCASWAIVDFYKRPKLGYYSVKRESAPIAIGMYRNETKDPDPMLDIPSQEGPPFDFRSVRYSVDIWGVNSSIEDVSATLKVDLYDVASGVKTDTLPDQKVVLKANQTSEFCTRKTSKKTVVYSRLVDDEGNIIASAGDWPQPLKYLKFPSRKVEVEVKQNMVMVSANKPVKGVELMLERDLFLEDNGFDVFPGDTKVVCVKGLEKSDRVRVRYYQK